MKPTLAPLALFLLFSLSCLPRRTSRSPIPHIPTPPHHPLRRRGRPIHGRPHIQIEDGLTRGLGRARIVIDDIPDLACNAAGKVSANVPIVSVKGQFRRVLCGPQPAGELQHSRFGREIARPTHEAHQSRWRHILRPSSVVLLRRQRTRGAAAPALEQACAEAGFPVQDLLPGALVQEVVHSDHGLDCILGGVGVTLAQESIVHLLRRGILPVALAVALWDCGQLAIEGQVDGLRGGFAAIGERGHVV